MAHPLVRDIVLNAIDLGDSARNSIRRTVGLSRAEFPIPPRSNMKRTSSPTLEHYIRTGSSTFRPIREVAERHGIALDKGSKILDFGAGVGRQLRLVKAEYPKAELFACDVEPSHVRWLEYAYPDVPSSANIHDKPLSYADDSFDLVYSMATFTHLSPEQASFWIGEFERILKPGGIACLSILGADKDGDFGTWLEAQDLEFLDREGFHHVPYDIASSKRIAEARRFLKETEYLSHCGTGYGQTFYRGEYIEREWQPEALELSEILYSEIDGLQDVVVLRKS